jgi:tetratricopeptide (TPR) repeat protein
VELYHPSRPQAEGKIRRRLHIRCAVRRQNCVPTLGRELAGGTIKPGDMNFESEEKLRQDLAQGSQDPQVFSRLAELVSAAGRKDEALSLYRQALTLPLTGLQKATLSAELGWLLYETGKVTEALSLANTASEVLSKEAETPEVVMWRGTSESLRAHCISFTDEKAGTEAAHSALECLKRVMVEAPNFDDIAGVYYDAARLSNLLWNPKDTIVFCEKCLRYDLTEIERLQCLVVFAEALRQEERFADAEKILEEALKLATVEIAALPRLYLEIGIVKRLQNRLEEAQRSFQQALHTLESLPYWLDDPHFLTHVYGNLGELYYESGQYVEAMAAFQKIIGYHPNDDTERREAFRWLGQSYHATARYAEARDCYEQVLSSPFASEAEKASVQEGLGKLHYAEGDYEKAIATFEMIVARFPADDAFHCDVLLWLGHSYEAARLHDNARDCFEKVVASAHVLEAEKASAKKGLSRLSPYPQKTWH